MVEHWSPKPNMRVRFLLPVPLNYRNTKMTKRTITIRQAEGGQDSRLFCNDLFQGYMRLCKNNNWTVD